MDKEKEWLLLEKHGGKKTEGFFADCERLDAGEPLAYIIGHVPFLNTCIYLDSHPLIPRTETEYWVSVALEEIRARNNSTLSILDLCAGSGCIGVSILHAVPKAVVDFVEIDKKHHPTILKNVEVNAIDKKRANILGGNLFEQVRTTYDFILTNPPYIDPKLERTEVGVIRHEPAQALWGGEDGVEYISNILRDAPKYLKPEGVLYIEHEPEQAKQIMELATSYHFEVGFFPDQFGIIRYTRAQL